MWSYCLSVNRVWGDKDILETGNGDNIVNVLNANELCTGKWLKWYILSYIYFTRIK